MNRTFCTRFACVPVLFTLVSCTSSSSAPRCGLAAEVDAACGGPAWRGRHALEADITVRRAGRPDLHGVMFYDIRRDRVVVRFPAKGGGLASCGFDGHALWIDCPFDSEYGDWPTVLQWATWIAVPYRLIEPSLRVREVQPIFVAGTTYRVAELERPAQGWGMCAIYIERGGLCPRGAVPVCPAGVAPGTYPKTFGFTYDEFSVCDDVLVPTRWSVWPWEPRTGLSTAGPVASITLADPRFVEPDPVLFDAPRDGSTRRTPEPALSGRQTHLEEAGGDA